MSGTDCNIALMVIFVPNVLCEISSNMLLAKFNRPLWYMAILILCWGIVMTLMNTVQNLAGCARRAFSSASLRLGFSLVLFI